MAVVFVTDGEQRAALAAVRSLGRAGHRVVVGSPSGRSLAGASRHASAEVRLPDALGAPEGFAAATADAVSASGAEVLFPIREASLLAVSQARAFAAAGPADQCRLPFPPLAQVRLVSDKAAVTAAATAADIAVPEQQVLTDSARAQALDANAVAFPVVIKPARSVVERPGGLHQLTVRHAASPAQLRDALAALPEAAYPVLLQQRIVGPGVGIFLLLWDGAQIAVFAHRRLREKPPSGGVSVYRESIPADPLLVRRSRALLDRFAWQGVAMVEYKKDERTGTPYLMEINGRFWGSLQLAVDAGVDFPALLAALALGERPTPVTGYRVGVRSRWWMGDVDQLLARLRRSPAELALPPGSPGRLAALREFLVLWRPNDRSEILRWSDPGPAVRELAEWVQGR